MADNTHGKLNLFQRYCLEYHDRNSCSTTDCRYVHKKKGTFHVISEQKENGFIVGKDFALSCCFYLEGYCMYAGNCRFRHEVELINETNIQPNSNNNSQLTRTNTPYTPTIVHAENYSSLDRSIGDENNATAFSTNYELDTASTSVSGSAACCSSSYARVVSPTGASMNFNSQKTEECFFIQGEICDMCNSAALHPTDKEQREKHRQDCIKQHEKNMEFSFAIARSKGKTCGVCFEVIMEKANENQQFGILTNCNHCFCLTCIRKWRQTKEFEKNITRACPECRITSDFVYPSSFWVDTKEDKDKLIEDYKRVLSTKDCKYFEKGMSKCPFGNKCFYRHVLLDGSFCDVGPPPRQRRSHEGFENSAGEVLQEVMWDLLDDEDDPWQTISADLEDLLNSDLLDDEDDSRETFLTNLEDVIHSYFDLKIN